MGGNLGKNVVIAVSLLAAGFLAAWLRFRPYLGDEGVFTDGARTIALSSADALRYAIWEAPEPLDGEVNSPESERSAAVSPDGRQIVFVVGERGLGTDLWVAELGADGAALAPRPLVEVNGPGDELSPAFGEDGTLLFASNRAGGKGGLDLWCAPWSRGVFGAPEILPGDLNTEADETDPTPVPGSSDLVFASNRERASDGRRRDYDLYRAWELPARLGEDEPLWGTASLDDVNSVHDERDPCFAPGGRALLFASDRGTDLRGDFDLYRASRAPRDVATEGPIREWLDPEPLVGVNGPRSERDPRPTSDGFSLLFARDQAAPGAEPAWDVWRARSSELVRTPGRPIGWREIAVLVALLLLALLAALAKRWRGLDILYKAFLISLLVHLALLLWSRDVVPTSDPVELEGPGETRVRIRLMEDPESLRALRNQERGGRIEVQRTIVEARAEATLDAALDAAERETEPAPQTAAEVERRTAELAAAPTPTAQALPERSAAESPAAPSDLRSTEIEIARRTAEARALEVEASTAAAAEPRAREARAEANADRSALAARSSVPKVTSAAQSALERSRRTAALPSAPARRESAVDRAREVASAAGAAASSLEVAAPSEEFDRLVADARREVEVSAAPSAALEGPARPEAPAEATADARALRAPADAAPAPTVAPSAASALVRSERASEGLAAAPAPRFTAGSPERAERSVPRVDVATLDAPTDVARTAAPAPTYDPLEGFAPGASDLDRDARPTAAVGALERAAVAGAKANEPLAGPAPSLSSGLERARPRVEAPAFGPLAGAPTPAASIERRTAPTAPAPVDLAGPMLPERPVRPETSGPAASGPVPDPLAELTPSGAVGTLERARAGSDDRAPERLAAAPAAPRAGAIDAPAPLRYAIAAPAAPAVDSRPPAPAPEQSDWERTPYQSRTGERKTAALREYGGSAETEAAVERGLRYLAARQRSDGRWGKRSVDDKYGQPMIGKTGLAVLAFMGAGHTPTSNTEYSDLVAKGLRFLVENQDPRTGHIGATNAYGHAIGTYALGEAYALTSEEWLRAPLTRATTHIVQQQTVSADPLFHGGWTYYYGDLHEPRPGTVDQRWPRASVSVWQVMALESARLGGVRIEDIVFKRARAFLVNAWDAKRGAFRYSHDPSRLGSEYPLLPGSTPASMFALSLLGMDLGEKQFAPARRFVIERMPDEYRFTGDDDFVYRARGNQYFWYYGTLAMFRVGGDEWRRWNAAMKSTLVPAQERDGSWRPISIYAGYAQDTDDDRSYTTAMNVLALEVYYRYFTPLLKVE